MLWISLPTVCGNTFFKKELFIFVLEVSGISFTFKEKSYTDT